MKALRAYTYQQTLETQDMTRLLALILIKMMQVTVLYVLTKKQRPIRSLRRKPVRVLCCMAVLDFICLLFIWYYVQTPGMDNQQHHTHRALIWIAACLLIQLIALFVMYELFISEEEENISLSARLQRAELEQEKRTLQTGNLILDAVVSSKLWLAQSKGIEASIQVVSLGKEMKIEDPDFCAIVGNLLDNAIEACERMGKEDGKRFIEISLLVKGRDMVFTIGNSFNGELKRIGNRYISLKRGRFHGIGLKHVDSIVEKYNGQIVREVKGRFFETCVVLPIL